MFLKLRIIKWKTLAAVLCNLTKMENPFKTNQKQEHNVEVMDQVFNPGIIHLIEMTEIEIVTEIETETEIEDAVEEVAMIIEAAAEDEEEGEEVVDKEKDPGIKMRRNIRSCHQIGINRNSRHNLQKMVIPGTILKMTIKK